MENYKLLNQKSEFLNNHDRSNSPSNKINNNQNYFRIDSNIGKQKNKKINVENEKEIIHLSSRRENEISVKKGPKILTINLPPEFKISNNNSRKNSSYEKKIYLQKISEDNIKLNEFKKNNTKHFSSTLKQEFEKLKEKMIANNNNRKHHRKLIVINLNKKENKNRFQKVHKGLVSFENLGYIHSETDININRRKSSYNRNYLEKEKTNDSSKKIVINNMKTGPVDFEFYNNTPNEILTQINYKSNLNTNLNQNYNENNYNPKKIKAYSNLDKENNTYFSNTSNISDNSRSKFLNNLLNKQKNIFIVTNTNNKLVFNPSSINPKLKKINSESVYNTLYLVDKYRGKRINNNIKYYNINRFYNNQGLNNHTNLMSESLSKLSSSQEQNSNSYSKDIYHIKTQTDFDNKPNYYESLISNFGYKRKNNKISKISLKSEANFDKNKLDIFEIKKKIQNINIGITYKIYNGYKFYFNLPNEQIYILKEVSYSCGKGLIPRIELWNKKYMNDSVYLKIYDHEINFNQRQIIWIIQYPKGGETLNDIINSVGFYDQNYLFDLVTKIYKSIIKIKEDKDIESQKYKNIPFCLCDIFFNVNEHIKIIPPLIRQIPIDSNLDKKNNNDYIINKNIQLCQCKNNIKQILSYYNEDFYSFFCLGFAIMQTITQNLIFDMSSYKYTLNFLKNSEKISLKEFCCFVHLLLNIEKKYFNNTKNLLFFHFLNLYPKSLLSLLHECTNFNNNIPSTSNEFLNLYNTNKNLNLSMKEVLGITTIPQNNYIKFDTFLSDFEILFKDVKIDPEIFLNKLNSNKVIHILSRNFGIDKEFLKNKIKEKIEQNANGLDNEIENNLKENYYP